MGMVAAAVWTMAGCGADSPESADASTTVAADARTVSVPDGSPQIRPDAALDSPDAGPSCPDDHEPNDTQGAATVLPAINDDDDNGSSITGAAFTGNEDWYTYAGSDDSFYQVDPSVTIVGNVQVCMFLACNAGETSITCPRGTTDTGGGPVGCCGTTDFTVDLNCEGPVSDDAAVHMQVTSTVAATCEDYTLGYHY